MLGLLYTVYNTLPVDPHDLVEEKICLKETGLPYERTTGESEGEALLPDIIGELCGVSDCILNYLPCASREKRTVLDDKIQKGSS